MKLYRGLFLNSESRKKLHDTIHTGYPADFAFGGKTGVIEQMGFLSCLLLHTVYDFDSHDPLLKKHFISFSSDRDIAEKFANKGTVEGIYETVSIYNREVVERAHHLIVELDLTLSDKINTFNNCFHIVDYNSFNNKLSAVDVETYTNLEMKRRSGARPKSFSEKEWEFWQAELKKLSTANDISSHEKEWLVSSLDSLHPPLKPQTPHDISALIANGKILKFHYYME